MWGTCRGASDYHMKEESYPEHKQEMWVEVCVPIQFTEIMPRPTCNTRYHARNEQTDERNETNQQTIDVGGGIVVPVDLFLTRFMLLPHVRKEIVGRDGVPMKVLESCSRTENVITYEQYMWGVPLPRL